MCRTRTFVLAVGALAMLAGTGCSDDVGVTGPTSSTAASITAVSTTMPSTTASSTTGSSTTASVTTTTTLAPTAAGVVGPPGRLPFVDVTSKITALLPSPVPMTTALELANEATKRLSASFAASGFAADVHGVSLVDVVRAGRPIGSVMASVIEVRNREESGGDTSPGYDLVVTMERNDAGNWTISKAEEQQVCSRGATTSGGAPVCV